MTYEIYKEILDKEAYFNTWEAEQVKSMSEDLKNRVHAKYVLKALVLQRDSFECQNIDTEKHSPELTIHHIKHKRNGGEDKERNLITVCKNCHVRFNKAKVPLIFSEEDNVPAHVRGHTFMLEKPEKAINWKQIRAEMKAFRKTLKYQGIKYTEVEWNSLVMLMKWLSVPYNEWDDEYGV